MADVLMKIYNALLANDYISEACAGRIKFYEYPENGDVSQPYIIIDPLDSPLPSDFADDDWLYYIHLFQVDIRSQKRITTENLALEVDKVLWKLGFGQYGGGDNEFDKATNVFRIAQNYRGKTRKGD
jgi:hypothetical protein